MSASASRRGNVATSTRRRLTIVIGLTQTLAWATTYYLPAIITGAVATSLGASRAAVLGGFSWALLIAGLAAPRIGHAIERGSGRFVLAAGCGVMAAGLLLLATARGLPMLYLAWTVLGLGMAMGLYDAAFATIGRLLGQEARPSITGVTLMAGFASTIGWPAGSALVAFCGWRGTLVLYAAVQLAVNLPLILAFVPHAGAIRRTEPTVAVETPRDRPPRLAFLLLASFFTLRAAISAVFSVHAITLFHKLGLPLTQAVAVAALFGPFQVGGRLLEWSAGRFLNLFRGSLAGGALLPAGALALLAGAPPWLFAACYGMSNGILTISRGVLPMHLFGAKGYAALLGQLALPVLLAQAASPTLAAPLVTAWPAGWMFAATAAVSALAWLCLAAVPRPARQAA